MLVVHYVFRKVAPSRGLPHHNKKPWTPRRAPGPPLGLFHFAQNYNSGLLRQSWSSSDNSPLGRALDARLSVSISLMLAVIDQNRGRFSTLGSDRGKDTPDEPCGNRPA